MEYSFDYIHSVFGQNSEVGGASLWTSLWNAERCGEVHILLVEATTDNWETSFVVYAA